MAYGLKYELWGKSVPFGKLWKVRLSKEGYTGSPINRNVPSNPFTLKKDSAGTIRGTSLDFAIRAITDFEFIEFYTTSSREWLVELVDPSNNVVWKGFNLPEEYQESYAPAPVNVGFTATDHLGLLKNVQFVPLNSRLSYLNIIVNCLLNTGIYLGYEIAISIQEARQNTSRSVLSEIYISDSSFSGMTCYDVIVDILSHFDADITQSDGKWLIRSSEDKLSERFVYGTLGEYVGTTAAPVQLSLGSLSAGDIYPTGSPLSLALKTAERSVVITENYGVKKNILPPQESAYWTDDDTLPGWTESLAHTKRVSTDEPYLLVQPFNFINNYTAAVVATVADLQATADPIEFSFDFAYIANSISTPSSGIVIGQPSAKLSVMCKMYDPVLSAYWYLSNTGWTHTLSRLEVASAQATGGIKVNPNWQTYRVATDTIPCTGTLTVILYGPILLSLPPYIQIYGAGFKNVQFSILDNGQPLPSGMVYEITLNTSTKAEKKEINWTGGDVPDIENSKLCFSNYTSLSDGTLTGQWKMGAITPIPLIQLIAKIHASQNRKAKQYLTGTIRGEDLSFGTVIRHDYPIQRDFEILEATYDLCSDRASVTLAELFEYADQEFAVSISDSSASGTSGGTSSGGSSSSSQTVNIALEMPEEFEVAGSPVSGWGTLLVTRKTTLANKVLAGPVSDDPAIPAYRALVPADIPGLDWSKIISGVPGFLLSITKAMVEAVLTGSISSHSHNYQASDEDLTAIAALSGTSGLLKKTAANTWALEANGIVNDGATSKVSTIVTLSQSAYDAITTKSATTLYLIV